MINDMIHQTLTDIERYKSTGLLNHGIPTGRVYREDSYLDVISAVQFITSGLAAELYNETHHHPITTNQLIKLAEL